MPLETRLLVRIQESSGLYCCNSCSKVIKSSNGYTNVLIHLKRYHPTYESDAEAALRTPNLLSLRLVNKTTTDMFRGIEWIVVDCLPLSFCERELVRRNAKLPRLSVKMLKLYLDGMVEAVSQAITQILPKRYGIVLDGWTSRGRHYVDIYAVFDDPSTAPSTQPQEGNYHDDIEYLTRRFILPIEDEGDLAQSLFDFIANTLSRYEQPWEAVAFMVGDNCAVNQCIPLTGCANHHFALAVKDFMRGDDALIEKVHQLTGKLNTVKGRALLRCRTSLGPVMRKDTRWSSTIEMLRRYTQLEPTQRALDDETVSVSELEPLLLLRSENQRITALQEGLANFESVTKTLQSSTLALSAARRLFDHTIAKYPELKARLAQNAGVLNYPALESGLVKIQRGLGLSPSEKTACAEFRADGAGAGCGGSGGSAAFVSFAFQAFKRRKTTKCRAFVDVSYVPPTSNEFERLFSRAKLVFNDLRKGMDRVTFETLMFLHCNRSLWNVYTVEQLRSGIGRNASN